MDSEGQKQPQGQPQERHHASTPGATLAAQREAMGLTIDQIADQLKLAPRQVVALEKGDFASLPNMAVTRGFIRAYAKVVRLDPAPLVAQIEVATTVTPTEHTPLRREKMSTTFSPSRFPTLTGRQSRTRAWIIGGAVALAVIGAAAAWQAGLISPAALRKPSAEAPAAATTVPAAPGTATTTATTPPLMSPNVPLVSTPGQPPVSPENTAPLVTTPANPTAAAVTPPLTPSVATPAAKPAAAPATTPPAAATPGANTLTLVFAADSWVEIRRPGAAPLISRLVQAGSTETFEIDRQSTLIVGKPEGVKATLRGQPLALPKVANGTISRVQVK